MSLIWRETGKGWPDTKRLHFQTSLLGAMDPVIALTIMVCFPDVPY